MSPEMLNSLITTGGAGGIDMNETTLLGAAILLEIPIGLVLLSRILKYKANRLANIIASVLMTLVMIGTLLLGVTRYPYIFFATIKVATKTFILWYAWTCHKPEHYT